MKWQAIANGRRILERYGTTESSNIFLIPSDSNDVVPGGSTSPIYPGVEVNLSNGNNGEILVQAPGMLLECLRQPQATKTAHDCEGFYKTSDIARRDENGYYFILGRASTDIVKSGGYKISALEIEREIQSLGCVSEIVVVGVDDEEFGQLVGVAVILSGGQSTLDVDQLSEDLWARLAGHNLPTLLYVTRDLLETAMGEIQNKLLVKDIFHNRKMQNRIQRW